MERLRFGRYETLRRIASGGMASVYLGRAVGPAGFERLVAIKVMHEHILGDPEFSGMFLDEARLAAKIRHPNVVPTLDVAEDGRFIVMEFVEGASLRDILREHAEAGKGPLPIEVSLRIIVDALAGMHAAHELKDRDGTPLRLVHRDISPHNILVGVDGIARITDFGIALAEARLTSTKSGQLKGKLPYMAPEQLENDSVDRRVDVYAAGCVLWEMLAGRRLFAAKNEGALALMIMQGPDERPSALNPKVPAAIDAACMQAIAAVDERFRTAEAFSDALEAAAQESAVVLARPRDMVRLLQSPSLVVSLAGDVPPAAAMAVIDAARTAAVDGVAVDAKMPSVAVPLVAEEGGTTVPESVPPWAKELRDSALVTDAAEPASTRVVSTAATPSDDPSSPHTATISAREIRDVLVPPAERPVAVTSPDARARPRPGPTLRSRAERRATPASATGPTLRSSQTAVAASDGGKSDVDEDGTSPSLVKPVTRASRTRSSLLAVAVAGPLAMVLVAWLILRDSATGAGEDGSSLVPSAAPSMRATAPSQEEMSPGASATSTSTVALPKPTPRMAPSATRAKLVPAPARGGAVAQPRPSGTPPLAPAPTTSAFHPPKL